MKKRIHPRHSIKELRALPFRYEAKAYSGVLIVPGEGRHDASGYPMMCIIGLNEKDEPIEVAAFCDDINWIHPKDSGEWDVRTDMFTGGYIHFWSNRFAFRVGVNYSSTEIKIVPKDEISYNIVR
jgi:hypothetical protein